jgi:hypothetical protein
MVDGFKRLITVLYLFWGWFIALVFETAYFSFAPAVATRPLIWIGFFIKTESCC